MIEKSGNEESCPISSISPFSRLIGGLTELKKHTLKVQYRSDCVDSQKKIYPNGVFGELEESAEESKPLKRIELFADGKKDTYGIIRTLSIAFTSEKSLLFLAQASDSVISIRALSENGEQNRYVEDRLILKRIESTREGITYRKKLPNLFVSSSWLERMNLERGNNIVISNPIENYMIPPPNLAEAIAH
ncbi:MAG TPA: hypothetical protein VJN71_05090 [Nitrososphaerales archaeon]|nr:hypothetical protein [Nitrososphaerales archaeon]